MPFLSRPAYGWTDVKIGNIELGTASYIRDVPIDALEAFIISLNDGTTFNLSFDAEGYEFGIVEFDDELYFVETADPEHIRGRWINPMWLHLDRKSTKEDVLLTLAEELVKDIEGNIDAWAEFSCPCEFYSKEIDAKKNQLRRKLEDLKNILRRNGRL